MEKRHSFSLLGLKNWYQINLEVHIKSLKIDPTKKEITLESGKSKIKVWFVVRTLFLPHRQLLSFHVLPWWKESRQALWCFFI